MKTILKNSLAILILSVMTITGAKSQNLEGYKYTGSFQPEKNLVTNQFQFNGYTNHWHNIFNEEVRYGNLFKMTNPRIDYTIAQSKIDMATEFGIPGLAMQEGFMYFLLKDQYTQLELPSVQKINEAAANGNILVTADPSSETGKALLSKLPSDYIWKDKLKSYQFGARDYTEVDVFVLENNNRKIFVVASADKAMRDKTLALIESTKTVLSKFDIHKGWFGAETLLKSVTCTPGHPLEVIGKGMNEGNSWFTFDGYMDFLTQKEMAEWLSKVNNPVVADFGFGQIHGLDNYDGLQVQSMFTNDAWINYAHEKGGYVFRQVWDPSGELDKYTFDGYFATAGQKDQIDNENVPFVLTTGSIYGGTEKSMVLFIPKGNQITKKSLWEAIMDRREVAVFEGGMMMGPAQYRNALQLMLIDRVWLEEYFGDRINLEATTKDYKLILNVTNTYSKAVNGTLNIVLPQELKMEGNTSVQLTLPANSQKTLEFNLNPQASAMRKTNPVVLNFKWGEQKKSTMTILDLPRAISAQQLLYGHAPKVTYPVAIHNFTDKASFPVKVEVSEKSNPKKVVYTTSKTCSAPKAAFANISFDLEVPAGNYNVKVNALGVENISQLGVGQAAGKPLLYELDLNSDGVNEYRMENDSVQITLLRTGARVIEYIVKSKNDNVLFKLWPEKASDDKRTYRKRGYYPYGGFEDFLGQGSMETHTVYDAEILQKEGDFVRVKMSADYYGNKLEKIFTLYGNSPLLEVQFALSFKNPEANVLGPQPILELGAKHWTEDVFTIPEKDGIHEYRMKPEDYFGRAFFMKEGWNAGYDEKENITFVGAFPVTEPLFLHMWMNHPKNGEAHFYYVEFQPWTPIYQKTTMYFSYYLWGTGGKWQNGVQELRNRNLISEQ